MAGSMKMRPLGNTGIQASVVGLGTFAIGGWFWGGTDEKKSIQAIQASLDEGVNLIDTAPIYGFGTAEKIVGKALKGRRDKAVIATKVGLRWDTDKGQFDGYADDKSPSKEPAKYKIHKYLGPDGIRYEVEQSLKRLGTDYIDLYQTHWQEPTTPIEVTMEALEKLKAEGKIRAIGVSNVSVEQLKRYGDVASAQERFTLIDRGIVQKGLVDYCVSHGISILSYFSLEQGLLTGSIEPGRTFKDGDTRKTNPLFSPQSIASVNDIVFQLRPFARKYNATVSQIVIALTALQKGITHVLVGARDAAQARENAGGGRLELSAEDLAAMNAVADKLAAFRR
ncbi:MAG TPA: aldo/keto reductase [Spirochaetia bacterium]|nr:aldo/keto reductase [Spirochaetia bacterium]